jgi:hypothetical protein
LSLFLVGFILTLAFANVIFLFKSDLSNEYSDAATISMLDYQNFPEGDISELLLETKDSPTVDTTQVPEFLLNRWVDIKDMPDYRNIPSNGDNARNIPYSFTTASFDWGNYRKEYLTLDGKVWARTKSLTTAWTEWKLLDAYGINTTGRLTKSFDIHLVNDYNIHYVRGTKIYQKTLDQSNPNSNDYFNITFILKDVGSGITTSFAQTRLHEGYASGQYLTKGGKVYFRNNANGWSKWEDLTPQLGLDEIGTRIRVDSYDTAILPGGYTQEYLTTNRGEVYMRFTRN